jgi:release factor glutamine methyltransferase
LKVRSNKVEDIITFCKRELFECYQKNEADNLIFILFSYVCGFTRTDIILRKDEYINESDLIHIYNAISELKAFKPVQYILGETEFCGNLFKVNESVLIPRPETEELINLIVSDNKDREGLCILDVGTGSGCIAVSLAKSFNNTNITGIDISEKALEIAANNAIINDVSIGFIKADILSNPFILERLFASSNIIVSNPPYIPFSEKAKMNRNVIDYEPDDALFVPDENPLIFYERITDLALKYSCKGSIMYFEINENHQELLSDMLTCKGVNKFNFYKDIHGKKRILKCII